jgi:hypothetical protein
MLKRGENMPGLRIQNDVFLDNSKESLNEYNEFKLESARSNKENDNELWKNDVSKFQKLNSIESNKNKLLKDNKFANFTASYLNTESLFDVTSFKSALSYDLVDNFPAFNNFEKECPNVFSRPILEEESEFKENSTSALNNKEAYEKVSFYIIIYYREFLDKYQAVQ